MKKFVVVSLAILALLFSCSEEEPICGESSNSGIIVRSVDLMNYCHYGFAEEEYVIRSQDDFEDLFLSSECDVDADSPVIDFNSYTLLGLHASGTCQVSFMRNVEKIEEAQLYRYSIKVKSCGDCKVLYSSMNWVLVPRLPEFWVVDFVVE